MYVNAHCFPTCQSLPVYYAHEHSGNPLALLATLGRPLRTQYLFTKTGPCPPRQTPAQKFIYDRGRLTVSPQHVLLIRPRCSLLLSPTVEVAIGCFPPQEGLAPKALRGWFAVSEKGGDRNAGPPSCWEVSSSSLISGNAEPRLHETYVFPVRFSSCCVFSLCVGRMR